MGKRTDYNEGYSMGYIIHAAFMIIAAYFIWIYYFIPGILVGLSATLLFLIKSGIEIDSSKKQIRSYKSLFNIRFGKWTNLDEINSAILKYTREFQVMNSRGTSTNVRTITFDLILIYENSNETKIYEFTEYKTARQVCNQIEKMLDAGKKIIPIWFTGWSITAMSRAVVENWTPRGWVFQKTAKWKPATYQGKKGMWCQADHWFSYETLKQGFRKYADITVHVPHTKALLSTIMVGKEPPKTLLIKARKSF